MKLTYIVSWFWVLVFIAEFFLFSTTLGKTMAAAGALFFFIAPIALTFYDKNRL